MKKLHHIFDSQTEGILYLINYHGLDLLSCSSIAYPFKLAPFFV